MDETIVRLVELSGVCVSLVVFPFGFWIVLRERIPAVLANNVLKPKRTSKKSRAKNSYHVKTNQARLPVLLRVQPQVPSQAQSPLPHQVPFLVSLQARAPA